MHDITLVTVPVFSTLANAGFALRREVFVIEQQIPEAEEFDADDLTATHVVAIAAGNVVGTLRIIWTDELVKLGRVVVSQLWRGQGISTRLLRFAMDLARDRGVGAGSAPLSIDCRSTKMCQEPYPFADRRGKGKSSPGPIARKRIKPE